MNNDWKEIVASFKHSPNKIEIIGEKQVPRGNTLLETIVNHADVIVINKTIRILCSGKSEYENIIEFNNIFHNNIAEEMFVFAHDVFGGLFAFSRTGIQYYAPDTLAWEELEMNLENFLDWLSNVNIFDFYSSFMNAEIEQKLKNLSTHEGILVYPFLWAKECDLSTALIKVVPFIEILKINAEMEEQTAEQ
ncbi:MAG: DUF2625 family protein [Oscillospiraceae bacterium]|nr:DUF2625 family protein [Oscillospiraceae bacterium]